MKIILAAIRTTIVSGSKVPVKPASWKRSYESGNWWLITAPTTGSVVEYKDSSNTFLLHDTRVSGTLGGQNYNVYFLAFDVSARAKLAPLRGAIPWWSTVREVRNPELATRRGATWRNRTNYFRNNWQRPSGFGSSQFLFSTIAGLNLEEETTEPSDFEE